ncbi:MAG: hypothetical protein KBT68_02220, partial [bacterium]|nr:hypothetical protein [Candidatus Colisoma equi]
MSEHLMAFGAALLMSGAACAAGVTWTGKGGVVDWNAATWSTGTPPGATDTVTFKPTLHSADFTVTPPANFTGKIVLAGDSSATQLNGDYIPGRIRIVNSNNASFTISGSNGGGSCVIEAFPGLELMIDSAYADVVDIPADVTFAPTATFPSGVTFTGVGTFRPATVAQLERAHAFRGVLELRGLANLDLARYDSLLLGREVILGEGASFSDKYADKLVSRLSMNKASDWTLNSALAEENPACRPTVDASGTLTLPHVDGAHNRTTAFLNRRFKADESFVAKFKLSIKANNDISGFGIVLHRGEATDVGSGASTVGGGSIPSACYGLVTLYFNRIDWGFSYTLLERLPGDRNLVGSWDSWRSYQQGAEAGLTLRNGNPIDVVVSCHNKILSVSLTQDGVTRTYRQDASGAFGDAQGALFGFFSHENSDETPSLNVTISDLEGWVSSSSNSPWQADPDFALTADNYYTYVDSRTSATSVTNSLRGADAFDASGRLRLCERCGWFGAAVSKKFVPDGSKFRMKWAIDIGTRLNNGMFTDIGFPIIKDDAVIRSCYGNYDRADGSGYNAGNRQYIQYDDPIKFEFDWWNSKVGMTRSWNHSVWTGTAEASAVLCGANSIDSFTLFYDGAGNYETEVVNNKEGAAHLFNLKGVALGANRRFVVVACANTDFGWQSYTQNWMRDLSLCYWNDAYVPPVSTRVVAPTAGTTDIAGLGTYAPFERITLGDVG